MNGLLDTLNGKAIRERKISDVINKIARGE